MKLRSKFHARLAACAALACLCAGTVAQAAEVDGMQVDDTIELGGMRLRLNGAGVRTVYIVKAYVAALYVREPSAQSQTLFGQDGPRRLSITMLADLSSEWIAERFFKAMRANHGGEAFARIEPRIEQLMDTLLSLGQMRKGERIDIDAFDDATRVSDDGQPLGSVPGEDVFDALLRVFVGERPIDTALKSDLLGE